MTQHSKQAPVGSMPGNESHIAGGWRSLRRCRRALEGWDRRDALMQARGERIFGIL